VTPRRYKRRVQKKHCARHASVMRRFDALYGDDGGTPSLGRQWRPTNKRAAFAFIDRQPKRYRMRGFLPGAQCTACGGCGSREAYLDELWQEAADEGIRETPRGTEGDGVFLSWEDGDAFACETRDAPEDDSGDGDDAESAACNA